MKKVWKANKKNRGQENDWKCESVDEGVQERAKLQDKKETDK